MRISISSENKKRLAGSQWAVPNKLFTATSEIERRDKGELSDTELVQIFDVWDSRFKTAIENADKCDERTVRNTLSSRAASFIDSNQEHREFRLQPEGLSFIVQLKPLAGKEYELTQL
ncbi:MAG TPA: hypothetical protein V6C63_18825 [Allocoleopsis sp.]